MRTVIDDTHLRACLERSRKNAFSSSKKHIMKMPFLIQIGNSWGIRIPESLIKRAGLEEAELELVLVEDGLLVKPVCKQARQGWEKQIREAIQAHGSEIVDHEWLDAPLNDGDFDD